MELLGQLGAHSTGPTQALLLWATRTLQGGGGELCCQNSVLGEAKGMLPLLVMS